MTIFIIFICIAASVVEALDDFENNLSAVCNQINTPTGINNSEIFTDDNRPTVSRPSNFIGTDDRGMEILCKTVVFIILLKVSYQLKHRLQLMIIQKYNLDQDDTL
jgi:hypothetical protein